MTEEKWLSTNPCEHCRYCGLDGKCSASLLCRAKEEFLVTLQKELLEHLLSLDCYEELLPQKIEEMIKQLRKLVKLVSGEEKLEEK